MKCPRCGRKGSFDHNKICEWEPEIIYLGERPPLIVKKINQEDHPCNGQRGCFATKEILAGNLIACYLGLLQVVQLAKFNPSNYLMPDGSTTKRKREPLYRCPPHGYIPWFSFNSQETKPDISTIVKEPQRKRIANML
jgi:hypothetical protein